MVKEPQKEKPPGLFDIGMIKLDISRMKGQNSNE